MSKNYISVGLLGFGTVGSHVYRILTEEAGLIEQRVGARLSVDKVAVANPGKKRSVKIPSGVLAANPMAVVRDPKIQLVVEAIGGVSPARELILAAISEGKHVVTANKEVLAKHGPEIFKAAARRGVNVLFEACVGGGVPILHALRVSLAANKIHEIFGIVNGTTNYILSRMTDENLEFKAALAEAQKLGYAEANPKADVDGYDAAYKAALLAQVGFGAQVAVNDIDFEGIRSVSVEDIRYAEELGYRIKLLAILRSQDGSLQVRVHPTFIPAAHPLASIHGAFNAFYVRGHAVGDVMLTGQGAGGYPTASAVVSDVIEIARTNISGSLLAVIGVPKKTALCPLSETVNRYYVRLKVPDRPGVLAGIAQVFGKNKVSIQAVHQKESAGDTAQLLILLHEVKEKNFQAAIAHIKKLPLVHDVSSMIRVGL